jgi:hypothetical protein
MLLGVKHNYILYLCFDKNNYALKLGFIQIA